MTTEVLVAVILVFGLFTLAFLLWPWKNKGHNDKRNPKVGNTGIKPVGTDCPLCGEHLPRGTRVHSVLFPGEEFGLMRIYGCPHCWAGHTEGWEEEGLHERRCPYCREKLPENGYVMAQVYQKPHRRTHVHVYGCTVCKPRQG